MSHHVLWLQTQQSFEVNRGETVLDAARRQGVAIPHDCTFGGCGTCRMTVVQGSARYEELPMALSEDELAQGQGLACQALCESDLVISIETVPSASDPVCMEATVETVSALAPDVTLLRLRLPAMPDGEGIVYAPGQYLNIQLEDGSHRCFSMANAPDGQSVDLHIKRILGGRFTDRMLGSLKPGAAMRVELPHGTFHYRAQDYQPMIFAATGTGIAPIRAILESLLDNDDLPPSRLYWGVRSQQDLYQTEELAQWSQRLYEFEFVPVLSRPDPGWKGRTGYVQDAVLVDRPDLAEHSVYLCGSPFMVHDAKARFTQAGADATQIYSDSFTFQNSA
ncbi:MULTISPECIES: 2Fe-2S iron-sulfur cluster-binding protein [unclassified Achromobacter]|uniref:2Fe-2S iron-sulfur cluster-binding protein n=1 Tax=unclassified Achromobacter TaxID=2626865 RepID=UPI000B51D63A|nr:MULTISPECIES: 2Fe-2S iron-sulfur cluster-binding protein [unclassified Achromobacter]OWT80367.1 CDP-6-deoxy-delta-3,4-glucoseen reductase [Achromobacter sp. HZ34]OWT82250.1 CDP-6-deoxy-delta-3,4-glucoseen reductase [Achromobacter sp. HZ28]